MMTVLYRIFLTLVVVLLPIHAPFTLAQEQEPALVFSTGAQGGGYWTAAERFRTVAAELGLSVEVIESTGSKENIEKLMDPESPVSLAFAQADAVQHYLDSKPDAGKYAEILENIGEECVFILTDNDSDLESLDDLADEAEDVTVFIGSETSGTAATFEMMTRLLPDLKDAKVRYGDTMPVIEGLLTSSESSDAVMVVHRPRAHSPEIDAAVANPDQIQFVEMEDEDLQATLSNGDKVYRSMRLKLPGAKKPVSTVCVKGYLLVSKAKLHVEQLKKLTDLVSFSWMRVYATP
jgi:TRAP-type uncharacterized transport system substrate-binding protein